MGEAVVGTLARRLTQAQADELVLKGELAKPDPRWVWDEEVQKFVPLGQAIMAARVDREQDPAYQLQQYDRHRTALLEFVASKLTESEYSKGGYPIAGKLHDYYVVPGADRKALTKLGAEKLASLFRYRRGTSRVTSKVETPEYVSALVNCQLVDGFGREAGSHEAAASTAEQAFRSEGSRRKYGAPGEWKGQGRDRTWVESGPPDYRAALNDIVARAGKRAFVGAVIVACAADEVFDVAASTRPDGQDEDDGRVRVSQSAESRRQPHRTRTKPAAVEYDGATGKLLRVRGKPIEMYSTVDLEAMHQKLRADDATKHARLIEALGEVLEARRTDLMPPGIDDDDDDLPF